MNFIIIHGVYNNPNGNWFPWLKKELEKKGFEAIVPKFPTPLDQSLESWMRTINKYKDKITEETALIGHSLGGTFILDYLEITSKKIKAAFIVSGFYKPLGSQYDEINETFVDKQFNWEKMKSNCEKFFVIASDNDPYIQMEISKELAKNLGAELAIIHGGGHLNKNSGYDKFPQLLEMIDILIKNNP